jgi:hypothetical protein
VASDESGTAGQERDRHGGGILLTRADDADSIRPL